MNESNGHKEAEVIGALAGKLLKAFCASVVFCLVFRWLCG